MLNRKFWILVCVFLVIVALLFVLLKINSPVSYVTKDKSLNHIIIGTSQGGALGFASDIIQSYELAKNKKLDVEFRYFSPAEAEMALKNRAVDVAYFAPISAVRTNLAGDNIRLFGPALYNHYVILVPPDSNVNSLEDLKGKKLGTLPRYTGGFTDFSIIWAFKGGDVEKDFKIIEGEPPILAEFLKGGAVDGILIFEPQATKLVTEGNAKRVVSLLEIWKEISGKESLVMLGFAAHADWLNDHQEEAKKLLESYQDAFEIIRINNEAFSSTRVKKVLGIEGENAIKAIQKNLPSVYPSEWNKEVINEIEDRLKIAEQMKIIEGFPQDNIFMILDNN